MSYFLGATGAPEPSGIHGGTTTDEGQNDIDADMTGVNATGESGTFSPSAGMDMMVDASSAADALAASAAQANYGSTSNASMGSPSVSFNFTHSPITGSLMMGGNIPGIGNGNGNGNKAGGGPLLPPSSPGTSQPTEAGASSTVQNKAQSRKLPSSSSLKSSSSYTSHGSRASSKGSSGRLGFVIGADDAPPPGRVTFADMGDGGNDDSDDEDPIDEDSRNNVPKMGRGRGIFGVEPPSTPATQYFAGPSSSSSSSAAAASSSAPAGQMQGHHRVPSASVLSTSSSSSSSLDKLGRAMAMNSVNPGQAVMEVHKTLQMKASELPTPPTPQMMMMLGNPAAAAAMAAVAASALPSGVPSSAATGNANANTNANPNSGGPRPGYSPISPAAGLGTPENMMLPPPPRWPMGGGGGAGAPPPPGAGAPQPFPPAMMNPQQQQAYFLQHQQFLQQLNYNAQMAYGQQFQQPPSRNNGQRSQKKELPPCPEVSNEDIVKAAAAAGIINPALGHGRPGRGGVMSVASPDAVGGAAAGNSGRIVETEEKRQQRLARNRESARKSRRQKKERLQMLAAQVSKLHDEVEIERRRCIGGMESGLRQVRADVIAGTAEYRRLNSTSDDNGDDRKPLAQALGYITKDIGPKCPTRSATANFQHSTLQTQMLPNYREFILWLSTQHPSFLYTAKEERNSDENAKKTSSSKQIGEELFGEGKPKKGGKKSSDDDSSKADLSAKANDARRFWPMFCYDLSISVDQEERIAQLQNSMFHSATLPAGRQEVSTAKSITRSLKHGVLYNSHSSAHRSEAALLDILTPEQSARYLQWFAANKDRCDQIIRSKAKNNEVSTDAASLDALSQRLNDALHFRGG